MERADPGWFMKNVPGRSLDLQGDGGRGSHRGERSRLVHEGSSKETIRSRGNREDPEQGVPPG